MISNSFFSQSENNQSEHSIDTQENHAMQEIMKRILVVEFIKISLGIITKCGRVYYKR